MRFETAEVFPDRDWTRRAFTVLAARQRDG